MRRLTDEVVPHFHNKPLPERDGELQYRVKNKAEQRVALESLLAFTYMDKASYRSSTVYAVSLMIFQRSWLHMPPRLTLDLIEPLDPHFGIVLGEKARRFRSRRVAGHRRASRG
jgi:hypothetical protein